MDLNNSDIIRRNTLFPLTDGEAYQLMDAFALAWIFTATLSAGLLMWSVNRYTLAVAAFSIALAAIWWTLSHLKRRR